MRPSFAVALVALSLGGCATTGADFPARLTALGTEPFWSLAIDGERLVFTEPDPAAARTGAARRGDRAGVLELTGKLGAEPLRATIVAGPCNDGMSDRTYQFKSSVEIGQRRLSGCAYPTDEPPRDRP